MSNYKEFNKLKSDDERWEWLLKNKEAKDYVLFIDNDDTFIVFEEDDDKIVSFDDYIGWSTGVNCLLTVLEINYEEV
jgi:hypothetical protein